jgi:hypothetical protein
MASNDNNGKRKLKEEAETSTVRKRLLLSDDDRGGDDSSDSQDEDTTAEEEVSTEELSIREVDTSRGKLVAKHGHGLFFGDDGDTTSPSSQPRTPETLSSRVHSDPNDSDNDDF